jgi:AcrR family transcriptional regulator
MNSAQALFLELGVAATTIEQITGGADVAKGTFYLYFSSKDDVLAALGDRFEQQLLSRISTASVKVPHQDWKGKLTAWAASAASGYLDSIQLHDLAFYAGHHTPTREGQVDNLIIDHLCELLQAGIAAGAWSVEDPRFTAVFLFSALHGTVDAAVSTEKRVNRGRLTRRLEQLFLRVLGFTAGGP